MGSGFHEWTYWHIFTITTIYSSSKSMTAYDSLHSLLDHECLLFYCDKSLLTHWTALNDVCLTNHSYEWITTLLYLPGGRNIGHHVEHLIVLPLSREYLCLATYHISTTRSLLFIAAGTWFPSRCSAMDYSVTVYLCVDSLSNCEWLIENLLNLMFLRQ
jgi:hypothetical protein